MGLGYPIGMKKAAYFCVIRLSYHYEKELPILAQLDYVYVLPLYSVEELPFLCY